ncbi:TPA: hypothetical protein NBI62_000836 [Corynebacterium striatum]|uniref:phage major capsid protein n=1 Tax=Corynebacterium striatum TaxID=43770 RepID=UPI00101B9DAA|nr:hypothetical protein [Corynebacterium striatum]HAT1504281.1 hypothetical protein [Corynebacterium striatum]HAT1506841.1 hypothetical protein [Corynebacterium striatum]HCD1917610.1 hypothetical protein [Corynebacterium striatum]
MTTINSAFDRLSGLTVDEMLANPTILPEIFRESFEGEEAHRLFFRTIPSASNVVGYYDAQANFLEDDVQNVAEFGEIPVSDPAGGELQTLKLEKNGIGIRVSWEQRNDNDVDAVRREMVARQNTLRRKDGRDALAALSAAKVQTFAATTAWNQDGSNPASDMLDAIELIQGAEDSNGNYFEYEPNVLWINPMTLTALKRNAEVQKLYIGDMAHENPLFTGIAAEPLLFGTLQVAKDFTVPKGEAYLGVEGISGFMAQREDRQVTDFYAERGDSQLGGANMSFRSDAVHRRGFGVDNPKSVVKLTGLMS